jgi:hypothetical protein
MPIRPAHLVLIEQIDAFLRATKMSASRLGRDALGDPQFVFQLRDGREPRSRTVDRMLDYLQQNHPRETQ